ncbi:MAG: glycosyltransferase family 2 protein [Candidatus Saccharimonadales bacterium]
MSTLLAPWLLSVLLAAVLLLSICKYDHLWRWHKILSEATIGLLIASLPFVFVVPYSWPARLFLFVVHAGMLLLAARLAFGRLEKGFLRHSTAMNLLIALLLIAVVMFGSWLIQTFEWLQGYAWRGVALNVVSLLIGLALLAQLAWTFKHYRLRKLATNLTLKELPTVSLCIPARNETHALEECLIAALASDYPKLEILVLDDCSNDKTAEVIRSFAHAGVRFVQGKVPAEGWLGRNQASQTLAQQAVGDYLVFMSVDTLLRPQSITKLVTYALSNKAEMITVLPQNKFGTNVHTLLGTMRYFWQIVLPITKRRVPVSSKFWLIKATTLKKLGGFASVRQKIVPEGSFARRLFTQNLYRFIISTDELGAFTSKRWSSQVEMSLRLLYPTFKRQPFYVIVAGMLLIGLLLGPFMLAALLLVTSQLTATFWLSVTSSLLLVAIYMLAFVRTHPRSWFVSGLFFPLVLLQELVLLVTSMHKYEFGEVNWKGRNVCYPVIAVPGRFGPPRPTPSLHPQSDEAVRQT